MIDWKAIKNAADLPTMEVRPGAVPKPRQDGFYPGYVFYGKTGMPSDSSNIRSDYSWMNNPLGRGFTMPGYNGTWFHNVRKGDVRPMLYNNPERERQETAEAYENRWRRLFAVAKDDRTRRELDRRRAAGQIPPIVLGNASPVGVYRLDDRWFSSPDERIQMTVSPYNGRSTSNVDNNQVFIGDGPADANRNYREELAHMLTQTPSMNKSVGRWLKGGDEGQRMALNGSMGSYELNPGELTRMMLLQKAAAARLGLPRFRNVREWAGFVRNGGQHPADGVTPPSPNTMDNPYAPGSNYEFDYSTQGRDLVNTLRSLELRMGRESDPDVRKALSEEYRRIIESIQDAIDMASIRKGDGTMRA